MIEVYATTQNGDGFVQHMGSYETIDDIRIYTSIFGPDVLITFFDDYKEEEDDTLTEKND